MKKYFKKKKKNSLTSDLIVIAFISSLFVFVYSHNISYAIVLLVSEFITIIAVNSIVASVKRKNLLNSNIYKIDHMTGEKFEEYVLAVFLLQGYKCYLTRTTADYGADVVLEKDNIRTVVQVKRWQGKVSIDAVQQIIGAINFYSASKGMVVTNSYYTENAKNLAASSNIELLDRNYIIKNWKTLHPIENETKNDDPVMTPEKDEVPESILCPLCNAPLVNKNGKYGSFLGCSNYPNCHYTKNTM